MTSTSPFDRGANCFGYERTSPLIIFTEEYAEFKEKIREDAINYLLSDRPQIFDEIEKISTDEILKKNWKDVVDLELSVERRLHFSQKENGFIHNRIRERCFRIKEQLIAGIKDLGLKFKPTDKLLDVGAGSGLNAQLLMHELDLNYCLLTDVVDYRFNEVRNTTGIDFSLFNAPFDKLATDQMFELAIVTNTLHHCDEPFRVFETLTKRLAPGATVMIIESCIGITQDEVAASNFSSIIPYQRLYETDQSIRHDQLPYLELNDHYKMVYGIFFDWIFNRVFHNENINVPYNFGKPADWNAKFEEKGFEVIKTYLMGFDQPTAIEFHTLHILKYRK